MGGCLGRGSTNTIYKSVCPSVMNKSAVWPGVHAPMNNQSPKSLCINIGAPLRPLCGGGGELVLQECVYLCVQMENVSLHCRCNNLKNEGEDRQDEGL